MKRHNLPGFSAERSIYRTESRFQTITPVGSYPADAAVVPQRLICHRDAWGNIDCVDPQCRLNCYRTKHGAALQACLADC